MSLNSIEEIKNFIDTIDAGEPIFNINIDSAYRPTILLSLNAWQHKDQLCMSSDIIHQYIGANIERRYDKDTKTLVVDKNTLMSRLNDWIYHSTVDLARETSPSDQPKKTNAYKEIIEIAYVNKNDVAFQDNILPIINYYHNAKTESKDKQDMVVHNNNVQALLNLLRKKYAASRSVR